MEEGERESDREGSGEQEENESCVSGGVNKCKLVVQGSQSTKTKKKSWYSAELSAEQPKCAK